MRDDKPIIRTVNKTTFIEKLAELVDRFSKNKDEYCSSNYPEAEVRKCFIDPLFEALGWDISNTAGKSYSKQDVVLEKTETEGRKLPDSGVHQTKYARSLCLRLERTRHPDSRYHL